MTRSSARNRARSRWRCLRLTATRRWPDRCRAIPTRRTATRTRRLTLRRPLDFRGDRLRLTFVYQATSGLPGTNVFAVDAITFHHGSGFETYGGFLSPALALPEVETALLEQSVVVEPGEGWNPDGPWWYFEIKRQGSNDSSLRLMAVTLEY